MKIWKFQLRLSPHYHTTFPAGAKIFAAGLDAKDEPALWAIVDPLQPAQTRTVCAVWTGEPAPDLGRFDYLNTLECAGLIYHVFVSKIP